MCVAVCDEMDHFRECESDCTEPLDVPGVSSRWDWEFASGIAVYPLLLP